jgi:hypothetical protein
MFSSPALSMFDSGRTSPGVGPMTEAQILQQMSAEYDEHELGDLWHELALDNHELALDNQQGLDRALSARAAATANEKQAMAALVKARAESLDAIKAAETVRQNAENAYLIAVTAKRKADLEVVTINGLTTGVQKGSRANKVSRKGAVRPRGGSGEDDMAKAKEDDMAKAKEYLIKHLAKMRENGTLFANITKDDGTVDINPGLDITEDLSTLDSTDLAAAILKWQHTWMLVLASRHLYDLRQKPYKSTDRGDGIIAKQGRFLTSLLTVDKDHVTTCFNSIEELFKSASDPADTRVLGWSNLLGWTKSLKESWSPFHLWFKDVICIKNAYGACKDLIEGLPALSPQSTAEGDSLDPLNFPAMSQQSTTEGDSLDPLNFPAMSQQSTNEGDSLDPLNFPALSQQSTTEGDSLDPLNFAARPPQSTTEGGSLDPFNFAARPPQSPTEGGTPDGIDFRDPWLAASSAAFSTQSTMKGGPLEDIGDGLSYLQDHGALKPIQPNNIDPDIEALFASLPC